MLPLSPLAKIQPLCFWQKVGVFLSIPFLAVFLAIFIYPLSKSHLYYCHKQSFTVIFTPMKFNEAVKFTILMTKIHLYYFVFVLVVKMAVFNFTCPPALYALMLSTHFYICYNHIYAIYVHTFSSFPTLTLFYYYYPYPLRLVVGKVIGSILDPTPRVN